ncbi:MAG: Ala-tRNA(Pro) hydrolase [Chloroflexi bacterium]|nr:Ala-tRNA(Pro) hydrolase [Chloroflexota bacterium]|tara:strand:+ start:1531 stop:2244 length:714 start_codon:yes stop_codon:yes gene_type:complete
MTKLLYNFNSYIKEFEAKVIQSNNNEIILDQTAFYPGGGGQPCDVGTILSNKSNFEIDKVYRKGNLIIHTTKSINLPEVGSTVKGIINWERRYQLMRTHTAAHILCGVIFRDYGASVTGGNMQPLSARMDFELSNISTDFVQNVENLINKEVLASHKIQIGSLSREEALKIPSLIRTKVNLIPPTVTEIRTIDIVGLDLQADGGTHVNNTNEVGIIQVIGHESKGKINKRIRISLDP